MRCGLGGAQPSAVKSLPLMPAFATPAVFLAGRPATERAPDAGAIGVEAVILLRVAIQNAEDRSSERAHLPTGFSIFVVSSLSNAFRSRDRETEYGAALSLALSGDSSRAQKLADDLEARFPEDTAVRFSYLPVLRARLALNRGDAAKAIDLLQAATPYELGAPRSAVHALYGALYPIYVRGEAYLAEGRGSEAAAEFQRILNHRGIVVSDPIGALAHLQLGRAYALSGQATGAKSAYEDFLALWKDADPNIPILKQANAEYAKLR